VLPSCGYSTLAGTEPPAAIQEVMSGYLGMAELLGRRTGEMHVALASDSSTTAFAPEPFTEEDLAAISASALAEAGRAFNSLESHPDRGPELLARRPQILERIRTAPALEFTASKIRVHGDYHLGQVLWSEGDFYILDFEGEPAKPIAQRRIKQSPLKDVAGMLRSFSYAAHAGLFAYTAARPDAMDRLARWGQAWETWTTAAFLRGYFSSVEQALFVPANAAQRDALLCLFVLEKALYEVNYELNNRPEWLRIPISGILRLVG
jgi:maltose alpha-D-glucosyltransferase/alpha-amylase